MLVTCEFSTAGKQRRLFRTAKKARHLVRRWRLKTLNDSVFIQSRCLRLRRAEGGKDGCAGFEAWQLAPFDGSTCAVEPVPFRDSASPSLRLVGGSLLEE